MTFVLCRIVLHASQRLILASIAAVALAALPLCSTVAHGQANCTDQTDYNCPVGPVYAMPTWGNVPWLNPEYFETIQTGDVDADGVDDLIGRDASGLHLYMYDKALGTWKPVLTEDGGSELVLEYFSDANGWGNNRTNYASIKLVELRTSGDCCIKLVARAPDGLTVFVFQRSSDQLGFPTGSWKQVSKAGPFPDKDGWSRPTYGLSIRYGSRALADASSVVVGWGTGGLETYGWNGTGWTDLGITREFGNAAAHEAGALSLQIASIDRSVPDRLLVIGDKGLAAYAFVPKVGWQVAVAEPAGLFTSAAGCDAHTQSCAYTLQTAQLYGEPHPVIVARRSGCNKKAQGMMGVTLNPQNGQWRVVFAIGPFGDCAPDSFQAQPNFSSIMAADIDGDGYDELVGRGPNGVLAYRWNDSTGRWSPIVTNTPALSNALWGSDPAYWTTLRTARIDGFKHALLARGKGGMRTWLYNGTSLTRPKPYGNFPDIEKWSAVVNTYLSLPNGVRQSYTDGTLPADMNAYIRSLSRLCSDPIAGNPLQFGKCAPPGTQNVDASFTTTVNQLLRELTYAVAANGHFDQVNEMQAQLFSQDNGEFPSIVDNLQLEQASQQTASETPYLNLFTNIAKLVASILGPEATIVVNGMTVAVSAAELFDTTPASKKVQQKYADIQSTIANLQQQAATNVLSSKQHVAGDYAFLSIVGQLRTSQVWKIDEGAYFSASRYSFTLWVMQQLLPTVWFTWDVTACVYKSDFYCTPPESGLNMSRISKNPDNLGVDFLGILQKSNTICNYDEINYVTTCKFTGLAPPQGLQNLVFGQMLPECVYAPDTGKGWVYPTANTAGCALQAGPSIFHNQQGWTFERHVCTAQSDMPGTCFGPPP